MTAPAAQPSTAPNEPAAPPAQATPPVPPPGPAAPPAPPATPPADAPTDPPGKVEDLPEWAQKVIRDARAGEAAARTNAKQAAADEARNALAQQIGKALGLVQDEPLDPAKLQTSLEAVQAELYGLKLDRAVAAAAKAAGAAEDLVTAKLAYEGKLDGLDPASQDFATTVAALVAEAVQNDPRLRSTPGAAPVGGAPQAGSGSAPARVYTRDQLRDPAFFAANKADILAAQREGRIRP